MLILAAALTIFVYGMTAALLGTVLPDFSERFPLSPKQNGNIALLQALGLIGASMAAGPLIDGEGQKVGLLLGLAIVTAATFLLPGSRGFGSAGLYMLLLGFGGGIVVTAANTLASGIHPARRGTTLNLLNIFFGLGALATPFLSANLLSRNSARLCYTVATFTGATLLLVIATPMPGPAAGPRPLEPSRLGEILHQPALWLLALYLFLYVSAEVGVWNWLTRHLIAQGIPESRALNILSLGFALGLLIGRLAVSPILIRVSALNVTLAASAAMAVTTWCMLRTRDPKIAGALVFLAGASMAPVFPTTIAIVGGAFPHRTGTAMGIVITCGWLGLAVSSRIIGAIAGNDTARLKKALLLLPGASVCMILVNLALRAAAPGK